MLINSICKDKGLPFTWKAWDLNPEKVHTCEYGHRLKLYTHYTIKVALQTNTSDCGVFACQYALHLMDIGSKDIKVHTIYACSWLIQSIHYIPVDKTANDKRVKK